MKPLCRKQNLGASKCALCGCVTPTILSVNLLGPASLAYVVDEAAGQCYSPEVLKGYMKLCQRHSIHLISDEIYALSVFDTGDPAAIPFTSVLSFDPAGLIDPDYLHVFYGMSKV